MIIGPINLQYTPLFQSTHNPASLPLSPSPSSLPSLHIIKPLQLPSPNPPQNHDPHLPTSPAPKQPSPPPLLYQPSPLSSITPLHISPPSQPLSQTQKSQTPCPSQIYTSNQESLNPPPPSPMPQSPFRSSETSFSRHGLDDRRSHTIGIFAI